MATIYNMKGTSFPSFTIGKKGSVIFQGTAAPTNATGSDGDIYIQHGAAGSQKLYQKLAGAWVAFQMNTTRLDQLNSIAPVAGGFIGTDANGLVIRDLATTKSTLGLGSAAFLNAGASAGQVPVLDSNGKLPVANVPAISIVDVRVVASNAERDALVVQQGDIAINTGEGMTYIYDGMVWRQIGYASAVQGIQGASSVKAGVVSLDTTDILSGVFGVSRGGTGFNSFVKGDLLLGTSAGALDKLAIGATGKVLTVVGGTATWGDLVASQIGFTNTLAQRTTTTTVQSVVEEIANTRAFVEAADVNPTAADYAGRRKGDFWINNLTHQVFVATTVGTSSATWQEIAKPALLDKLVVVSKNGDNANDGSYNNPMLTVGQAVIKAGAGGSVMVMPGTYVEDLAINANSVNLFGNGAVIQGKLSLNLSSSGFRTRGIKFRNLSQHPVSLTGSTLSDVRFENATIEASSDNDYAVRIEDQIGSNIVFKDTVIKGIVNLNATSDNAVLFDGCEGSFAVEQTGGKLYIDNSPVLRKVFHSAGQLNLRNIGRILKDNSGTSVTSTAASGRIVMTGVSLRQMDDTFGALSLSGSVEFMLNDVDRDPTQALNETKRIFGRNSQDLTAAFRATNYGNDTPSVTSHLKGIDAALGAVQSSVIKTFNALEDTLDYTAADAKRTLVVNTDGTGIEYSYVLGTASSNNTEDFATAGQGLKADTAVQPTDLSEVAKAGKGNFLTLTDAPSAYTGKELSVVRVNSDATGLEFGGTLSPVAYTNQYSDLTGLPTLGTVAALDYGNAAGQIPMLDANGKLNTSTMPALAITDVYVVEDFDERDALEVQGGDVAKVTSTGQTFIYDGTTWVEMVSPDAVRSVNGKAGDIVLVGNDINVVYAATNYTAATDSLKDHIAGIDTKLGTLALVADLTAFQAEVADTYQTKFDAGNEHDYAVMTYETKADANQFKINVETDYFSKADAATLKQEIEGEYATKTELNNQAQYNDTTFYTKAEAQAAGQGNADAFYTKDEAAAFAQTVEDTYETKAHASDTFQTKSAAADAKSLADATYQTKTDASTFASTVAATYDTKADASAFQTLVGNTYETKTHASDTYLAKTDAASTYETQAHASATYETATHAAATYDTKSNTTNTFVAKSAYTALGDILVGAGAGSYSKLAKGSNGQVLTIDSSGNVAWASPQAGGATALANLTDVALSSPVSGQALVYNGTKWANATINTSSATGDKITTGTTSVQTAEVANTVTVNANGKRVANFVGAGSTAGERLDVTADNGKLTLAATNTAGSGNVDLEIKTQGGGAVKFNLAGTASMRSGPGEALLIQPGDAATGDGVTLTLMGGSATASGGAGGDILLSSGNAGAGGVAGQVKLSAGYVPASSDSVVNKSYVDGRRLDQLTAPTSTVNANNQTISNAKDPVADQDVANRRFVVSRASQFDVNIVTTGGTYNVTATDHMILVKAASAVATTVVLPAAASATVGKSYTIKDAKGSHDVTIRSANNETIDGQATQTLAYAYESITVLWNGSEWNII